MQINRITEAEDCEPAVDSIARRYDDAEQAANLIKLLNSSYNVRYMAMQRAYSFTTDFQEHFKEFIGEQDTQEVDSDNN